MFDIPSRYAVNNQIDPKTFIRRDMKKSEKERIRDNMLSAQLVWQIAGEEIPSLINDDYNCSVIMGLDIELKTVKGSTFFAELIQRMVKAPCVIRFYDYVDEIYSFAHKRLSQVDASQVVILEKMEIFGMSQTLPTISDNKLVQYLSFGALLNKSDKLSLYLEAMVKAYIISHPKLYSGIEGLLDSKVWYNRDDVLVLFEKLLELERLKAELKVTALPADKARLNGDIKGIITKLGDFR